MAAVGSDARDVICVFREEPAVFERRKAERFAGSFKRDAVTDDFFVRQRAVGDVSVPLGDEVAVDLVGEDDDLPPLANFAECRQIFTGPSVARGIVRIAQNQSIGIVIDAALQILKIHEVPAVQLLHPEFRRLASAEGDVAIAAVVVGRRQQDLAAGRRERLQGGDERRWSGILNPE